MFCSCSASDPLQDDDLDLEPLQLDLLLLDRSGDLLLEDLPSAFSASLQALMLSDSPDRHIEL